MKVVGITFTYNEARMVPYVMKYWERINPDKLVVYDNQSTDNTVELLKQYPFVEIGHYGTNGQFDEFALTHLRNNVWKREQCDWIILNDFDEVPYCDTDIRYFLDHSGVSMITTPQHDIVRDDLPPFNNNLLHTLPDNLFKKPNTLYDYKTHIFNPNKITDINWEVGCHRMHPQGDTTTLINPIGLYYFHLNYLGKDYLMEKAKRAYDRLPDRIKRSGINHHYKCYLENYDEIIKDVKRQSTKEWREEMI